MQMRRGWRTAYNDAHRGQSRGRVFFEILSRRAAARVKREMQRFVTTFDRTQWQSIVESR